jgi:hypothetical protein
MLYSVRVPSTMLLTVLTVVSRWTCDAIQTIVDDGWQLPEGIVMAD